MIKAIVTDNKVKVFTAHTTQQFLTELYDIIKNWATKQDETIDNTGVHLETWLYQGAPYAIIRTEEKIHTIYNQALNNMYVCD